MIERAAIRDCQIEADNSHSKFCVTEAATMDYGLIGRL